jgi:hypothetical protein
MPEAHQTGTALPSPIADKVPDRVPELEGFARRECDDIKLQRRR